MSSKCRPPEPSQPEPDHAPDRCWCGMENPYFAPPTDAARYCGGSGMLECECGGDLCVCHWHGHQMCPGCEDCEGDGLGGDDEFDRYHGDDYDDYDPDPEQQ